LNPFDTKFEPKFLKPFSISRELL